MTKTAFVTGATGFVGLNLLAELHEQGWDVIALHRASSDVTPLARFARVRRVFGDVTDQRTLRGVIPPEVDCVFHVAGNTSMWNRTHVEQIKVNVRGTRNVVSGGTICAAMSRSSKPAMAMSAGMRNPRRWHSKIAPTASVSAEQNTARTSGLRSISVAIACTPAPRAVTVGCAMSACVVTSCASGYGDCDGSYTNGCEADLTGDVRHCGACDNACVVPSHAATTCNGGVCGMGACESGWADCDHDPTNGCEAHPVDDVNHCGGCAETPAVVLKLAASIQ